MSAKKKNRNVRTFGVNLRLEEIAHYEEVAVKLENLGVIPKQTHYQVMLHALHLVDLEVAGGAIFLPPEDIARYQKTMVVLFKAGFLKQASMSEMLQYLLKKAIKEVVNLYGIQPQQPAAPGAGGQPGPAPGPSGGKIEERPAAGAGEEAAQTIEAGYTTTGGDITNDSA
jgi:hypothetical protein